MKKKSTKPTASPQTSFGTIRVNARAIWRGPLNLVVRNLNGEKFYGWPTLLLEIKLPQRDYVESRAVYANLYDKSQKSAILRAVAWDGATVRRTLREHPRDFRLALPARFVAIPVRRLAKWLDEFENLTIQVSHFESDELTNIKRLRIERDYTSQIFEKVWQTRNPEHNFLNASWGHVWMQMTKVLASAASVNVPDEDFWFVNPEIRYDLENYQSDVYIPKTIK